MTLHDDAGDPQSSIAREAALARARKLQLEREKALVLMRIKDDRDAMAERRRFRNAGPSSAQVPEDRTMSAAATGSKLDAVAIQFRLPAVAGAAPPIIKHSFNANDKISVLFVFLRYSNASNGLSSAPAGSLRLISHYPRLEIDESDMKQWSLKSFKDANLTPSASLNVAIISSISVSHEQSPMPVNPLGDDFMETEEDDAEMSESTAQSEDSDTDDRMSDTDQNNEENATDSEPEDDEEQQPNNNAPQFANQAVGNFARRQAGGQVLGSVRGFVRDQPVNWRTNRIPARNGAEEPEVPIVAENRLGGDGLGVGGNTTVDVLRAARLAAVDARAATLRREPFIGPGKLTRLPTRLRDSAIEAAVHLLSSKRALKPHQKLMLCVIGSELAEKIINKSIQLRVFDRALLNRMSPCSIVSLQFDSYTLATDSLLATASMTHWSSLSRLSLIGNEMITDDGLSHLKTCRSLGQLDLQLTKMTDRALVHILALKALTRLNLSYTRITSRGLQKFVTNDEVPELEVLILRGCMGITSSDTFAHLAELLLPNSLRILSVRDCPLSCPLNRPPDSRPWVLRELDVAQIPKFSDTDLGLIAEHCPQLVEVDMCGSGCGDGGQLLLKGTIDAPAEQAESDDTAAADGPELGPSARAFLTAMAQLQVVKLPSAADEGINSIVRAMCGLAADSGGGGGGEAAAASAMALTALDLRGFAHLTDAGLRGVARLHETLRVLNLSGTAVTDACLSPPARGGGVAALVRLVELHLDRTAVGNGVALAIADMATLEVLSVSDTNMADAGLSKFNAARCRFTLKRLNVANTIVTETGVCRGLHGFVALTSLNIERTRVKSLDACLLRIASEANANGVCLKDALLSGSGVRHSVADSDDI